MKGIRRRLQLTDLTMELLICHAQLAPERRVEQSASTLEALRVSLDIEYQALNEIDGFDDVFNYARIATLISEPPWTRWDRPFEILADELLKQVLASAEPQAVTMRNVTVRIERPELAGLNIAIESHWAAADAPARV